MKARARCRNCGVVTTRFRMVTIDESKRSKDPFVVNGLQKPTSVAICKNVQSCRTRYDRAQRLKRHREHVNTQRALKGRAPVSTNGAQA